MSDSDFLVAAGDLLGDLELIPLPGAAIPVEAIIMIKALDENGDIAWFTRYTDNLSQFEIVGALNCAHQLAIDGALESFLPEFPDDDDEDD